MNWANLINSLSSSVQITATVGVNVQTEPIPVSELKAFRSIYPDFVIEVFHGKMLQHWHDCTDRIFCHYVDLHISGQRSFDELGKLSIKLDFADQSAFTDQVWSALRRDFGFWRYADRHKLINKLRSPAGDTADAAGVIHKHVHLRNAFQHHLGILQEFSLKELGCHEISLIDDNFQTQTFKAGQRLALSIPELDNLRRSLLLMAQKWRT